MSPDTHPEVSQMTVFAEGLRIVTITSQHAAERFFQHSPSLCRSLLAASILAHLLDAA
jgi:uroporphyrinogen-III synthase